LTYRSDQHPGGLSSLFRAQQRRRATEASELTGITDDQGSFDLKYLGLRATVFATTADAKRAAPNSARRVLQRLQSLIAD